MNLISFFSKTAETPLSFLDQLVSQAPLEPIGLDGLFQISLPVLHWDQDLQFKDSSYYAGAISRFALIFFTGSITGQLGVYYHTALFVGHIPQLATPLFAKQKPKNERATKAFSHLVLAIYNLFLSSIVPIIAILYGLSPTKLGMLREKITISSKTNPSLLSTLAKSLSWLVCKP